MMFGVQCCENPPSLSSSCGVGTIKEIGGLKSYVTGSSACKLAILLVSDVYDFFYGDPFIPDKPERGLSVWIESHVTAKGFEDSKPVITALRSKGITAIGAAGFCWGANVVVRLANSDYIQAAVLLHPSGVIVDDFEEVKAPIAVLGAEFDKYSPPELLKQFAEVLSTKPEVSGYVKIFPGVAHGWAVRYKDDDENEVKSAEEAHQNMLDWFDKFVKKKKNLGSCKL